MTRLMRCQQPSIPWCQFKFVTTPDAPASIDNFADEIASAQASFKVVLQRLESDVYAPRRKIPAIVVGCFSDHPLTQMLRERFATDDQERQPAVLNLLQGAVYSALATGDKFGVVTTLPSMVEDIENGVYKAIGTTSSTRFVGVETIGFSAGEVNQHATEADADPKQVLTNIHKAIDRLKARGAKTVILGCSGAC